LQDSINYCKFFMLKRFTKGLLPFTDISEVGTIDIKDKDKRFYDAL